MKPVRPKPIAGAVCPQCEQQDRLMLYRHPDGLEQVICVDCGFKAEERDQALAAAKPVQTIPIQFKTE